MYIYIYIKNCINSLIFQGIVLRMNVKGTTLVNTKTLTTTATATAQLYYIVNELNQDVQYFQRGNLSKNSYTGLKKKVKSGMNVPRIHIY